MGEPRALATRVFACLCYMISITAEAFIRAQALGVDLRAFIERVMPVASDSVHLCVQEGLALILPDRTKMRPLRVDFLSPEREHRRRHGGGRGQDLVRACGLHKTPTVHVIDATAGFGRDAYVLACEGAQVTLLEQHPILAAMLQDGLARARAEATAVQHTILQRMAVHFLRAQAWQEAADVVYLDPMFPPRQKSAAVKQDMQVLHRLAAPPYDVEQLLAWALQKARKRVVVKRPRLAPTLTEQLPSHQLLGQSNRFDLYLQVMSAQPCSASLKQGLATNGSS